MATEKYINECKNGANSNRLGKVTIAGTERREINQDDHLSSFSINSGCYVDGSIIGSIYVKKVNCEFVDLNDVDFIDKNIEVRAGILYEDETTEYVNFGYSRVEKPSDNKTSDNLSIVAYDSFLQKLDKPYICHLNFENGPVTVNDLFSDLVENLGAMDNTNVPINGDLIISQNPFTNNETNRIVLQSIAKVSCSYVIFNAIKSEIHLNWLSDSEEPDYIFEEDDYSTFVGGDIQFGPINSVTIKNSLIDDENVTLTDDESITENGEHSIIISEDYILYSAELRQQAITNIFERLNGLKYVNANLVTYYGKPFLKIGDKIRIIYNGVNYDTYVLTHTFTYDGTFKSVIDSPILTEQEIKTKQNITLAEKLRNTQIKVNKQDNEIELLTQISEEQNHSISSLTITAEGIKMEVSDKVGKDEVVTTINQSAEQVEIKGNRFVVEADNIKINADGTMTCKNATITGGNLTLEDDGTQDGASIKIKVPTEYISDISLNDDLSGKKITAYFDVLNYEYLNGITEEYFNETGNQYINLYESSNGYSIRVQTIEDKGGDKIAMITLEQDGAVIEEIYSVYEDETVMTELQPITLPDDFGTITEINKQEVAELIVLLNTNERETSYSGSGITSDIICEYNYSQEDLDLIQNKIANRIEFTKKEIQKYDLNKDGKVTSFDLLKVSKYVTANITPTKPGKLVIDTHAIEKNIQILDGDGNEKITIGLEGIHINGESILPSTKILWEATNVEGGYYMNGSQTINLSEKITKQKNGIVLVWYGFDSSTAKRINGITSYQFVPKWQIESNNKSFVIQHMAFDKFAKIGTKNISISDDSIVGNNSNTAKGTSNGITYDNSTFILSYVLGV